LNFPRYLPGVGPRARFLFEISTAIVRPWSSVLFKASIDACASSAFAYVIKPKPLDSL
jgi:hypothetical protein